MRGLPRRAPSTHRCMPAPRALKQDDIGHTGCGSEIHAPVHARPEGIETIHPNSQSALTTILTHRCMPAPRALSRGRVVLDGLSMADGNDLVARIAAILDRRGPFA